MRELRDKLLCELMDYSKGELTRDSLSIIDTLAHACKNVCKIMMMMEVSGEKAEYYEKSGHEVIDELEKVVERLKSM